MFHYMWQAGVIGTMPYVCLLHEVSLLSPIAKCVVDVLSTVVVV